MTHNLTQSELDKVNIQWILENRIQTIEMRDSAWKFQRSNTMELSFYKLGELNGSIYVNVPLRNSALLNFKGNDKYCFIWSILAHRYLCEFYFNRVSSNRKYFNELNINGFDLSNGFKCNDMHRFEKIYTLSINMFELNFYQDHIK